MSMFGSSCFFLSSFFSKITDSVVRIVPATDAAFSIAVRVTLAGSNNPASVASTTFWVLAL